MFYPGSTDNFLHVRLVGGEPNASTEVSYVMSSQGDSFTYDFGFKSEDGDFLWVSFWNYYDDINITFYDANGNDIGSVFLYVR